MLVHTDDTFTTTYDQATSDDLIAQAKAGVPILDKKGGEWFRISAEREEAARAEISKRIAEAPTISELRAMASARIDTDAERARQAWATGGALQSLVYEGKRREAAAYALDGTPDPSTYPLLAAEIGLTTDSLAGVAAIVSAKSAGWTQAAAGIERIRVGAKMGIDAATDQAGIDAVVASMGPWPVPG